MGPDDLIAGAFLLGYLILVALVVSGIMWLAG